MPRFDATNSSCRVLTRRAGMLSAVGHDLELRVADLWIELGGAGDQVRAELDARSVEVADALAGDAVRPGVLSARDRRDINRHIADDVLESSRFPKITFHSTRVEPDPLGYRLEGRLGLHGVERTIALLARRRDDRLEAELKLHQPDYGIRPFKALAGALRVDPDVVVRISLPAPALPDASRTG